MSRRTIWLVVPILAALVVLYLYDPETNTFYPQCLLSNLTGYRCATCGGLRAIHHLLHGNLAAAWSLNPFLVTVGCIVGIELAVGRFSGAGKRRLYLVIGILIAAVVFTVMRNL